MSDSTEKEQEFSDIELCYKAMGLSFSDDPERVENTYKKLKDEYTRVIHSSDIPARAAAAENLKQLEELFKSIKESLIYRDYAREYENYKALKAGQAAARKHKQQQQPVVKDAMFNCPYCHKPIARNLKVCIYCHGKIMTHGEEFMAKLFSARNIVVFGIVVVLVAAAVVIMLNPQLLRR